MNATIAIVGLAPGLHGANRTGQPFVGDASGDLLFATLRDAGLVLHVDGTPQVVILNAVKCLPPENRPTLAEMRACQPFLRDSLAALKAARSILTLGRFAHQAVLEAYGLRPSTYGFSHGAHYRLPDARGLFNSYHCSRYNQNTGRLTAAMLLDVVRAAQAYSGTIVNPATG